MKQFLKSNSITLSTIIFSFICVIIIKCVSNTTFWDSFLSNLLATSVGLIVGIPIAITLSKYQEREVEKERKAKILKLLRTELFVNLTQLSSWKESGSDDTELIIMGGFLKNDAWKAFSDGGELEWIKDPELLGDLSWAYSTIQSVKYVLEKHYSLEYIVKTRGDKAHKVSYARKMIKSGVDESIRVINEAIKAIGNAH
jgi:hypothetical protein